MEVGVKPAGRGCGFYAWFSGKKWSVWHRGEGKKLPEAMKQGKTRGYACVSYV